MTRLLLDTHVLFWLIYDPDCLSAEAVAALRDPGNRVYATLLSAQDIATKISSGRWEGALELLENFEELVQTSGLGLIVPVAIDYANSIHLPGGGDPVDRLIFAQAKGRAMTLVSSDANARAILGAEYPILRGGARSAPREPKSVIRPRRAFRYLP